MANNYLQFSQILDIDNEEQAKWLEQELTVPAAREDAPSDSSPEYSDYLENWFNEHYVDNASDPELDLYWPGFDWEIGRAANGRPDELWIRDNGEWGELAIVAHVVQKFLKKFRPDDFWTLTWAETCSKPRIGEFSGGGVVITAKEVKWFSTEKLVNQYCQSLKKRLKKKKKGEK